jgi:hypothetical protein
MYFSLSSSFIAFLLVLVFPIFSLHPNQLPKHTHGVYPSEYSQFWFLYEKEKRTGQEQTFFRPFFSSYQEKPANHRFKTSLYPIYFSQSTGYWSKWSLFFLLGNETTQHEDLGEDSDYGITPLFQWGNGSTSKDEYSAFFPIYGTIKSKLSWSEIHFVLFPIYTSWNFKEFEAKSILWPFFLYGKSDVRKEYRALPFFAHKSHIGKFEHNSLLWPFFSWGRDNLDKKEPSSFSFAWLLFGYKKSYYGNMKSIAIMPILGSMSLFSYGYDKRTAAQDFSFLFFLFQYSYSNDKDYRKRIFFPFYGYSHYASKEFYFITPFFMKMKSDTYTEKTNFVYFVPFYISSKRFYPKEERTENYLKIWPFYRHYQDAEGNSEWNTLSLFPIRSLNFERNWDPIWSLLEYKDLINGEKRFSFLMRIYTQRWSQDEFHFYIPFLADYSRTKSKQSFDFFYGLLGYENTTEKTEFKLLWFLKI